MEAMRSFWTSGLGSTQSLSHTELSSACSATSLEPILVVRLVISRRTPSGFISQLPLCANATTHKPVSAAACSSGQKVDDFEPKGAQYRTKWKSAALRFEKGPVEECEGSQILVQNERDLKPIESTDERVEEEIWRECVGEEEVEGIDNVVTEASAKEDLGFAKDLGALNRPITANFVAGEMAKGIIQIAQLKNEEIKRAKPQSDCSTNSEVSAAGQNMEASRLIINLDLKLYWAKRCKQLGQLDKAEQLLRQCIKVWPDDGRAYVALGKLLSKCKRFDEARKVYEEGCQVFQGENAYIWQAWALLEVEIGNITQGRKLFDAATAADKTHAASWHSWAVLELRMGSIRKAKSLIQRGLKFCAPNEYFYQTLACIAVKEQQYDQARFLFMKATQINSKSAASWMAWGLLEMEHGEADISRQLFQKGMRASPKNRYILQAWARFEAKEGNKDRARELFKQGVLQNPQDPVMLQSFALFEYDCSNVASARDLIIRASTVDPNHQPIWLAWGWMEWKERNFDSARRLLQKSIFINSRNMDAVRAFQLWGIIEGNEGNPGKARALFKRALNIDSQNVPTWTSWVALEEQQGNAVRAEELRNIFFQQSVEVVEGAPWENFSEMLSPAIDSIKKFLKLEPSPLSENKQYNNMRTVQQRGTQTNANWRSVMKSASFMQQAACKSATGTDQAWGNLNKMMCSNWQLNAGSQSDSASLG